MASGEQAEGGSMNGRHVDCVRMRRRRRCPGVPGPTPVAGSWSIAAAILLSGQAMRLRCN
jgi:hypothetical protein